MVSEARALGIHHFSFVRSGLVGLDLADAFERYLAWGESTSDYRYVQGRWRALMGQIIQAGIQHDAGLAASDKITHLLALLKSEVPAKPVQKLPSLDEWIAAEGIDQDMWSQAELLAEYKAHFGLDNEDAIQEAADAAGGQKDLVVERVRALNHLETVLSNKPAATDRLDAWFAVTVVKRLRAKAVLTLGDLVRFINAQGYRWYVRIPGFGQLRAQQVVAWLVLEQDQLGLAVSSSAYEPVSKAALRQGRLQLVPIGASPAMSAYGEDSQVSQELVYLQRSPELSGQGGQFRSHMANTLGATTDLEAVNAWLSRYDEKPHTQRSYRKEIERFLLWCAQERHKALSSIDALDCQAYRTFLKDVPASWIEGLWVGRGDVRWRAFRGQVSPASQKQALVILQALFGGLVDAGYLVANPMRVVIKNFDLPPTKINLSRSFSEAEWSHVLQSLDALPDGAEGLRLKCILELLVTSGLRLDELVRARHKHLRVEQLPGLEPAWVLTVTGKRNKVREVPLQADVVELLARHGREFVQDDLKSREQGELPLIRTLFAPVAKWGAGQGGHLVAVAATHETGLALSASGVYALLKRFFRGAAKTAAQAGLDPDRFERASTHWMRHTFVRQALVDGVPIEVASELAGHASIDTTSIYSTQELARKIAAVQGMKRRQVS